MGQVDINRMFCQQDLFGLLLELDRELENVHTVTTGASEMTPFGRRTALEKVGRKIVKVRARIRELRRVIRRGPQLEWSLDDGYTETEDWRERTRDNIKSLFEYVTAEPGSNPRARASQLKSLLHTLAIEIRVAKDSSTGDDTIGGVAEVLETTSERLYQEFIINARR